MLMEMDSTVYQLQLLLNIIKVDGGKDDSAGKV